MDNEIVSPTKFHNRDKFNYKTRDNDFKIVNYNDYELLRKLNFKVNDLKQMCRHYKLKLSGNKNELKKRIYNYLKFSFNASKIQKIWRNYLCKIYKNLHGPALFNRNLCVNDTDFYTMDKLNEIDWTQFFSFRENNSSIEGSIYGFDILSLYTLINNKNTDTDKIENPYNRNIIPSRIINRFNRLLKISKIFNDKINITIE